MPYTDSAAHVEAQRRYRRNKKLRTSERERGLHADIAQLKKALRKVSESEATMRTRLSVEVECRRQVLEENSKLWREVARISPLRFPMTLYSPEDSRVVRVLLGHASLFPIRDQPEASWERSKLLLERRREAKEN